MHLFLSKDTDIILDTVGVANKHGGIIVINAPDLAQRKCLRAGDLCLSRKAVVQGFRSRQLYFIQWLDAASGIGDKPSSVDCLDPEISLVLARNHLDPTTNGNAPREPVADTKLVGQALSKHDTIREYAD